MAQYVNMLELFNLREKECSNSLENMIYMLKNMNLFEMSPFKEKNDAFRRLLDVANLNALTAHERAVYDENLKNYRDWRSTTEYAVEEAEKKGIERGREEGREEGMEKGLEEGMEKGKAEEQRQIATNFKKRGIDIAMIAQCTGLSMEEIEKL